MADGTVNPELVGQVMGSIDYTSVIAQPLKAMFQSQVASAEAALDFIMRVGFEENENGKKTATYAEFEYEQISASGESDLRKIRVPMLCIINIPQLEIQESTVTFHVEVSQTATMAENISAGGEIGGSVGWGPFSVNLTAKASYSKDSTRKTDTRAKQEVVVNIHQAEPPEALNIIMEVLREAALGTRQKPALEAQTGIPAPQPIPEHSPEPAAV